MASEFGDSASSPTKKKCSFAADLSQGTGTVLFDETRNLLQLKLCAKWISPRRDTECAATHRELFLNALERIPSGPAGALTTITFVSGSDSIPSPCYDCASD
jgi:hypothetical protein